MAQDPLGVRHQRGDATIGCGHRRQAARTAVRIERVGFAGLALVVDKAHRALHGRRVASLREIGEAFAVRDHDGQTAAGHAGEKQRRAVEHLDQAEPGLELLALVAGEAWPVAGAWDDRRQRSQHLAAVAHPQRQRVLAAKKGCELVHQHRVEQDRPGPTLACAQRVAIAEAAAGHQALELVQTGAAGLQVAHVDVEAVETGLRHRVTHLDL